MRCKLILVTYILLHRLFLQQNKTNKKSTFLFSGIPSTIPGRENQAFQSEFAFKAHKSKNELIDKS